jgi:hypothetical protein
MINGFGQNRLAALGERNFGVGGVDAPNPFAITGATSTAQQFAQGNPFMRANVNPEGQKTGENNPLRSPMFLGYRDNQALYGGAKLFVLA